jgi:hypothetical protein
MFHIPFGLFSLPFSLPIAYERFGEGVCVGLGRNRLRVGAFVSKLCASDTVAGFAAKAANTVRVRQFVQRLWHDVVAGFFERVPL